MDWAKGHSKRNHSTITDGDDFDDDASRHISSGMPIPGKTRT